MELLLVRHAIAAEGRDDDARPLTRDGRARFARVVKGLRRVHPRIGHIVHSPKLRAVQTAHLLCALLANNGTTEVAPELAAEPGEALLAKLRRPSVALVGHEPWLSQLLALLVSGDARHAPAFELKKGAIAWLEGAARPGKMRLRMLLPPGVGRRLARHGRA